MPLPRLELRRTTLPIVAAGLFLLAGAAASATLWFVLVPFARELDIHPGLMLAVPALFAALWALIVFQGALRHVRKLRQAVTRGVLVALLTWVSFSVLATAVWSQPGEFWGTLSRALIVSGIIGGAPMLAGTLVASALVGRLILSHRENVLIHR